MRVKVIGTWRGHDRMGFYCQFWLRGNVESFYFAAAGMDWSRKAAHEALDRLELYGVKRRNVRFYHV